MEEPPHREEGRERSHRDDHREGNTAAGQKYYSVKESKIDDARAPVPAREVSKPVPLDTLRKSGSGDPKDKKNQTEKNVSALRDALASIMKGAGQTLPEAAVKPVQDGRSESSRPVPPKMKPDIKGKNDKFNGENIDRKKSDRAPAEVP